MYILDLPILSEITPWWNCKFEKIQLLLKTKCCILNTGLGVDHTRQILSTNRAIFSTSSTSDLLSIKRTRGQDMPRIFTLYFITVLFLKCILLWGRYIRAIFIFTLKINKTVSIRSTSYKVQLFEESVMSLNENKKSALSYSHGKH